jgi:hypothetical protein
VNILNGEEVGENQVEKNEEEVFQASQPTQRKRTSNFMAMRMMHVR